MIASIHPMTSNANHELVFEVSQEADGGYVAECMTESIVTQGDTWEELRAMVIDAVDAYFFDSPKPQAIRLHLVRNEVVLMK
jgi:predicted RNase H-like HicB family nuclease